MMTVMKRRVSRVKLVIVMGAMLCAGSAGVRAAWVEPSWKPPTVARVANSTVKPVEKRPEKMTELKLIVSAPLRVPGAPGGEDLVVDRPVQVTPIPEPATSTLVMIAGMALCYRPRRRGRTKE